MSLSGELLLPIEGREAISALGALPDGELPSEPGPLFNLPGLFSFFLELLLHLLHVFFDFVPGCHVLGSDMERLVGVVLHFGAFLRGLLPLIGVFEVGDGLAELLGLAYGDMSGEVLGDREAALWANTDDGLPFSGCLDWAVMFLQAFAVGELLAAFLAGELEHNNKIIIT